MAADERLRVSDALRYLGTPEGIRWVAAFWFAIVFIEALARGPIPLGGLLAFLLRFVTWFMLYRIASETLLDAAGDTPGLSRNVFEGADGLALRHIGLWLIGTFALVAATVQFGPTGTLLGAVLLLAVLPAATILLTLGRGLLAALWPPSWLRLAHRIGTRDYVLLCAALVAIGLAYAAVSIATSALQPGGWLMPIAQFTVWSAGVLAWFHLAGRAVALHAEALHLVELDTEVEAPPARFTLDADALWEEIRTRGGSREMHAELARQLTQRGDRATRLSHGRMHVETLLLAFEAPDEAVDRASALLDLDPGFALSDAEVMRALVFAAADQEQADLAVRFAENFLAVFPNSATAGRVRLRVCELLADRPRHAGRTLAGEWLATLNAEGVPEDLVSRMDELNRRWSEGASGA